MEHPLDGRVRGISLPDYPDLLSRISEIDEFKGWWRGRYPAVPARLGGRRKKVVAASAAASIRIGWIGLPQPHPGIAPGGRPAGEGRPPPAVRYARALEAVFDGYARMILTQDLLRRFHADLADDPPEVRAPRGAYRTSPGGPSSLPRRTVESIALRPADPEAIPQHLETLIRWTTSRLSDPRFHPLLVVAVFLLEFLAIQPFAAGNGRVSRLLTNLLLLQGGYTYMPYASLEEAILDRKAEYYLALRKSQASRSLLRPDMAPWFVAFLDALRIQVRGLRSLLERQPREDRYSENQRGVMALLDRHRDVTNRLVTGELGLPRETAKQVLNRLVALNAIERIGSGRATRYRRTGGG